MFRKKDAEVYYINERSRSASEELASLFSYCIQRTDAYSVNWYFSASEATGSLGIP